jgi:hypothetical protein
MTLGCFAAVLASWPALAASNPPSSHPSLTRALDAPDYTACQAAWAELQEKSPRTAAASLPLKFALEISLAMNPRRAARSTPSRIATRARAVGTPGDLADAVYHGIRRSVKPACGTTPLGAKRYLAREFLRHRASFVPLITRAAETALSLAPNFGPSLTARADAAMLTGDLKLAAECTRKSLVHITNAGARANTLRLVEELERAAGQPKKE